MGSGLILKIVASHRGGGDSGGFAAGVGRFGGPSLPIGFERRCCAKFTPIPSNRHKSTKCAGSANVPGGSLHHLTQVKQSRIYGHMKTTIELPDAILERTKVAAAHRRTSMKNLVIQGLEMVLQNEVVPAQPAEALARLRGGYHLGAHPMTSQRGRSRVSSLF